MSALRFYSADDFTVENGTKGYVLCLRQNKGLSLVLFYSTECVHCHDFLPIFKQLAVEIPHVSFGLTNVSKNQQIIEMARITIAPLTHVPYLVLYVNGRPFMRYDGPRSNQHLREFLQKIIAQMSYKTQFIKDDAHPHASSGSNTGFSSQDHLAAGSTAEPGTGEWLIPDDCDTSTGIPYNIVCDGLKCYLSMDTPGQPV